MTTGRRWDDDGMTTGRRRDDDGTTTGRRRDDDGMFGTEPRPITCHKVRFGTEPRLMTCHAVDMSCRRHVVVMVSSSWRRRAVVVPSSCCRPVVVLSSSCRRLVVVVSSSRRRMLPVKILALFFMIIYKYYKHTKKSPFQRSLCFTLLRMRTYHPRVREIAFAGLLLR